MPHRPPAGLDRRRSIGLIGGAAWLLAACTTGNAAGPEPEPGTPWHHTEGGFRNPPGSPEPGGDRGDWFGFFWRGLVSRDDPDTLPDGHVLPKPDVLAGLQRHPGHDTLTWLGHASFLVRMNGVTLLTDPYLTRYASPLQRVGLGPTRFAPPGLEPAEVPAPDIVLLSHNHYDHMDLMTFDRLNGRENAVVVLPLKVGAYLGDRTFARVVELDWWQSVELRGLKITLVPAIHFSARGLGDRNASLWGGYLVETPAKRLYFAGDTAYGPAFPEIGRRLGGCDVGLVPIGAYDPRELMRGSHCTPEEAVQIGRDLGAKRLAAMHWGTIRLTDEPPFEPPTRFLPAAHDAGYRQEDALVLPIGATRAL